MDEHEAAETRPVPVGKLAQKPYSQAMAYPQSDPDIVKTRLDQLIELGIDSMIFSGSSSINGTHILGKGCVGIVIEAITTEGQNVAVKVRRTDSNRPTMHMEAEYQRSANKAGVGPTLRGEAPDILTMDLVRGETLPRWLSHETSSVRIKPVVKSMLAQCFKLDQTGLDHGELSHAHKNVLVTAKDPFIVDFESASRSRYPHNLTSLVQYLLFSGKVSGQVQSAIGFRDKDVLLDRLREYKSTNSHENFESVMTTLKL